MEDFAAMLALPVQLMQIKFTLYGFTLSFWDILLWGMVATVVLWVVWGFFK